MFPASSSTKTQHGKVRIQFLNLFPEGERIVYIGERGKSILSSEYRRDISPLESYGVKKWDNFNAKTIGFNFVCNPRRVVGNDCFSKKTILIT